MKTGFFDLDLGRSFQSAEIQHLCTVPLDRTEVRRVVDLTPQGSAIVETVGGRLVSLDSDQARSLVR